MKLFINTTLWTTPRPGHIEPDTVFATPREPGSATVPGRRRGGLVPDSRQVESYRGGGVTGRVPDRVSCSTHSQTTHPLKTEVVLPGRKPFTCPLTVGVGTEDRPVHYNEVLHSPFVDTTVLVWFFPCHLPDHWVLDILHRDERREDVEVLRNRLRTRSDQESKGKTCQSLRMIYDLVEVPRKNMIIGDLVFEEFSPVFKTKQNQTKRRITKGLRNFFQVTYTGHLSTTYLPTSATLRFQNIT